LVLRISGAGHANWKGFTWHVGSASIKSPKAAWEMESRLNSHYFTFLTAP